MQKIKIANSLTMVKCDENDFIYSNKEVYDWLTKILNSFDDDENLGWAKDYLENLNGDIFIDGKQVVIYVLKQHSQPISFLIFDGKKISLIWTHFDYVKLGFATILIREAMVDLHKCGKTKIEIEIGKNNLIMQTLLESFSKIEGMKSVQNELKSGNICYKFDTEEVKTDKVLQQIQNLVI